MPKTYENIGLQILYPDNWIAQEEPEPPAVTLVSPDGSFMSITQCEPGMIDQVVGEVTSVMSDEYEEIEEEALSRRIGDFELTGKTLRFVYLDLIVTSEILILSTSGFAYLIQIQAEDRDMTKHEQVFHAMLVSLCNSLQR